MNRQSQAAVLVEPGQPLQYDLLTLPDLKHGQVLVDIAYSGVCKSQLLEVRGKRGPDPYLPHTLGHEGSGTVVEVGGGVSKVNPGDQVVISWIKGDGLDVPSTTYQGNEWAVNSGAVSTFMTSTVTCENRLTPIASDMPLREAALLGCAIPTGAGMILNTATVQPGHSVLVVGVGGIGLSAVMAAGLMNATTIIAVDVFAHKLEQARAVGATHLIDSRNQNPLRAIRDIVGRQGVDCAIEAVGLPDTMELAFNCVRDSGGICVLAGNVPHGQRISLDPFDLIRGKRIVGTWGGETKPDRDIPRYVDLYLTGKLDLDALVTNVYELSDINWALDALEKGSIGRAMVEMR